MYLKPARPGFVLAVKTTIRLHVAAVTIAAVFLPWLPTLAFVPNTADGIGKLLKEKLWNNFLIL